MYLLGDTLLLVVVFENFRNMCLGIYQISCPFLFCIWLEAVKKTIVELGLLINIDKLLMVEKGIKGGVNHAIHQYVNTSNNYMKKN